VRPALPSRHADHAESARATRSVAKAYASQAVATHAPPSRIALGLVAGTRWPALNETYADLRRVGLDLSRDESLFPGLIAAVRARRASPAKPGDAPPADPVKDPVPAPPT
jgi:hypothetical protein